MKKSGVPEIQGGALTPLDRFWLDTARNSAKESATSIEDAAKQLIGITSLSQGIYFAAISLSDVKKGLAQFSGQQQWMMVAALVVPLVLWIVSLWFAIRVFKPETYKTNLDSPDLAREMYYTVVAYKKMQLQRAYLALVLGFVPLILNVIAYLVYFPASAK